MIAPPSDVGWPCVGPQSGSWSWCAGISLRIRAGETPAVRLQHCAFNPRGVQQFSESGAASSLPMARGALVDKDGGRQLERSSEDWRAELSAARLQSLRG